MVISYKLYRAKIQPKRKKNIVEAFMNCPIDADIAPLIAPRSRGSGRATPVNFARRPKTKAADRMA